MPGTRKLANHSGVVKPWVNEHNHQLHSKQSSLYPQRSVVLTLYQGNFSFQQMDAITENQILSKCRILEPRPSGFIYKTTLTTMAQESLPRREQKGCKSQRHKECCYTMSPRNVRSYTLKISPTWLPKHTLNKNTTIDMLMRMGKSSQGRSQPYTKNDKQQRNAESRKSSLSR